MRLLKGVLVASFATLGLWVLPANAQSVTQAQVGALVEALRRAAPQTGQANDGLYSDWKVKGENIPRWSRFCTGREMTPAQFQANPQQARAIMNCIVEDLLKEEYAASRNNERTAVLRSAAWWMTGDSTQYNNSAIAAYTQRVLSFYEQERARR
ncbi:hypothetical protein QQ054_06405 [Oscillatoria amoena NRMC-F 0135]|nr:hypothetical protein [Oscillatoria laete-virens]MCD8487037.1 hypothetical protein [Desertifilum sp.]MDI9637592.1 hypothetical protein [Geitlerinema splendidum]MDL5045668.1 hypothetical protein [Oscillatoria amoena NRMC-F 0135]MDL5052441.1 hypothetical protein [Oscillatoria laete-virens NRMC-F 0139]